MMRELSSCTPILRRATYEAIAAWIRKELARYYIEHPERADPQMLSDAIEWSMDMAEGLFVILDKIDVCELAKK